MTEQQSFEQLQRRVRTLEHQVQAGEITRDVREYSVRQLQAILNNVFDGIVMIDAQGRIELFNPAAERIFNYRAEEVIGQNVNILQPEPYRGQHDEYVRNYLFSGHSKIMGIGREVQGRRKDGQKFPMDLAVTETRVGAARKFIGIVRDISDRKRAEERLHKAIAELTRSNKDLEQFAYVASHDLQEPLRAISGFLQLVARRYQDKLAPEAERFIAQAIQGAARMQQLINDLLNYSRLSTRSQPFQKVDLEQAVDNALANLQVIVKRTAATIHRRKLPAITGDANQLVLLFQNLIANALKFRSGSTPKIHIWASRWQTAPPDRSGPDPEQGWRIAVQDNGIGIDPRFSDKVFMIFQRLHSRDAYPGTGIGLAICKKIVQRHNGRIWFESQPGRGTTFHTAFPDISREEA